MASPQMFDLTSLIDDAKCYELIRQHRWPDGVYCPLCNGRSVIRNGRDETHRGRQRYRCQTCGGRFDDLTGAVLAGHHQPLWVRVLCLYLMVLNLSNRQIARELNLNEDDVQAMTSQLREGLVAPSPEVVLDGEVEVDEVYIVAGHKGNSAAVKKGPQGPASPAQSDGFHEVHVNTIEGFWSLLRSWLRPHGRRYAPAAGPDPPQDIRVRA
jgi:transposase-like protein